jgi:hypothetical protein
MTSGRPAGTGRSRSEGEVAGEEPLSRASVLVDPADDAVLGALVPVALRALVRVHGPALVARAAALSP